MVELAPVPIIKKNNQYYYTTPYVPHRVRVLQSLGYKKVKCVVINE